MSTKITRKNTQLSRDRKQKMKNDVKEWLLFTVIYIIIAAFVFGSARVHFPDPIQVFGYLYLDIGYAISMLFLTFYVVITGVIFKK